MTPTPTDAEIRRALLEWDESRTVVSSARPAKNPDWARFSKAHTKLARIARAVRDAQRKETRG